MTLPLVETTVSDLVRWAEPLLGDVLASGYRRFILDPKTAGPIIRCHVLLWRSVLNADERTAGFRDSLLRHVQRTGMTEAEMEELNREILHELMHVIAIRYQRSPRIAGQFSLEVARAACRLAEIRARAPVEA